MDAEALQIERAGLQAWPGIDVDWDGAWVRRAANGYTQRANSVQSLDPADDGDSERRIAAASQWYMARGLRPIFRLTPLAGAGLVEALDRGGWQAIDRSFVFAMPLGATEPDPRGRLFDPLGPEFLAIAQRLQGYDDAITAKFAALLGALKVPARGVVMVASDGTPLASSLMSVAEGVVITGNVVTHPASRRQGLGAAMMRTGLAWAAQTGATLAALNVAADNLAAQAMYRSLGYTHRYDYVYRIPGADI